MELRCGYVNGDLSNCIYVAHCVAGSGDGGGGWGGDDGGGGSGGTSPASPNMLTPDMILVNRPDIPVNDIKQYLKCFNTNDPATLTVYAQQPVPGTNDTYAFIGIKPDVGHAFISLSQNGITRVFGFYPASDAAPIHAVSSIYGDDSRRNYNVSITTTISPVSLHNLLSYTYGYTSNDYSLQNNNCVNFSINACAQFGLTLPNTSGVWVGVFGGSNPGDFGEDMRVMTLPSGVTRNSTGGVAPSNSGGC